MMFAFLCFRMVCVKSDWSSYCVAFSGSTRWVESIQATKPLDSARYLRYRNSAELISAQMMSSKAFVRFRVSLMYSKHVLISDGFGSERRTRRGQNLDVHGFARAANSASLSGLHFASKCRYHMAVLRIRAPKCGFGEYDRPFQHDEQPGVVDSSEPVHVQVLPSPCPSFGSVFP